MDTLSSIAGQINEAAKIAEVTLNNPEGKLREIVSPIWEQFLKEKRVGLSIQIQDELTLANGRADTVFNKLILEYKKPNTIKPKNDKNRKLISQIQGYILDLAKKERFSKQRLLGVAFDGNYFLFMRYVKRWIVDEPISVSEKSIELFLKYLEKLTSKAALIPENLIRDFAVGKETRNKVAADCIKVFYNALKLHGEHKNTKGHVFFEQWKVQFAEVHGSLEQKKIDQKILFTSYGFSKKEQTDFNVFAFFFALDSYYALLMKLLSYQVVGYYTMGELTGLPLHEWENLASDDLNKKCDELEEGGFFRNIGIRNFLEGDLFSWYTQSWNEPIFNAIRQIIKHLNDYDPETMEVAPDETRDILKKLYQYLVPKQIRHDLGEYYTPDWLAERCLNQLNYNGDPKLRLLDPGCGSGTFIILAIKRAKDYGLKHNIPLTDTLKSILRNIYGFDLNPLAVISARTNYMLAIADLLKYKSAEITIPVYLCDSINPPQAREVQLSLLEKNYPYEVKTAVGNFLFPNEVVSREKITQLANLMEDGVKDKQDVIDFLEKTRRELQLSDKESEQTDACLIAVYERLIELEHKGINGVWARIIKNAFAPLFVGQFDLIAGNPPWVNWESLPKNYRDETKPLWIDYGLFSLKGHAARLGGGKKDISMLMMYVTIDKYLKEKGRLCFVITQTLFKSQEAGDGFRRFHIGESEQRFKVEQVDDMVKLQPFEGANNRTSIVSIQKGLPTIYPLSYIVWNKKDKGSISIDLTFHEVFKMTKRINLYAAPIGKKISSPWITVKRKALNSVKKFQGQSFYKAYTGSYTGGMNGVYWINIIEDEGHYLTIENMDEIGKKKVKSITAKIEQDLVFPLLRGKDISKWYSNPKLSIIISQDPNTRTGYDEKWMKKKLPKTYEYFKEFESFLWTRKSSSVRALMENGAFYSMFAVGSYTFSDFKVVWKSLANGSQATVLSPTKIGNNIKPIIPEHNTMFVPFENVDEANYFCAVFNSSITSFLIISYIAWFYSKHVLENIKIPKYDENNAIHQDLSNLSKQCHEKTAAGIDVTDLEEQINELAAELWGLTNEELRDIKESLDELK